MKNEPSEKLNENIIIHYVMAYLRGRDWEWKWLLSKEFWTVTVVGIGFAFVASKFIGPFAIFVPFVVIAIVELILLRQIKSEKVEFKRRKNKKGRRGSGGL